MTQIGFCRVLSALAVVLPVGFASVGASANPYTVELVAELNPGTKSSNPGVHRSFFEYDGDLWFSAENASTGRELYRYDGVNAPTLAFGDWHPGSGAANSSWDGATSNATVFGGDLYLTLRSEDYGVELFRYTGSGQPTLVQDFRPGDAGGDPFSGFPGRWSQLHVYNDRMIIDANGDGTGNEFWVYDGANPPVEYDLNTSASSEPGSLIGFAELNGVLYFNANIGTSGNELVRYDGTGAPTLVHDIDTGTDSSITGDYMRIAVFQDTLYFAASDGAHGDELWKYDGVNNPSRVADINGGSASSRPGHDGGDPIELNGKLVFGADDGSNGIELWAYDGVNAPSMVADINPTGSSNPGAHGRLYQVYNDKLYFIADDGTHGRELWVYDGVNTPSMVMDINPFGNSDPGFSGAFAIFEEKLFFTADDGVNGSELWVIDEAGIPELAMNINAGSGGSGPDEFFVYRGDLYFHANGGSDLGSELYRLLGTPVPAPGAFILAAIGLVGLATRRRSLSGRVRS